MAADCKRSQRQVSELKTGNENSDCQIHTGNEVRHFCEKHDALCCKRCVDMFHKACKLLELTEAATGVKQSAEMKRASFSLKILSQTLTGVRKDTEKKLTKLEETRQNALVRIHQFKQKLINRLDEVEEATCAELESRYKTFKQPVDDKLKKASEIIDDVDNFLQQFETPDDGISESHMFMSLKKSKHVHEKGQSLVKDHDSHKVKIPINFQPDGAIEHTIAGMTSLGTFENTTGGTCIGPGSPSEATMRGLFSLKDTQDDKQPVSYSACVLGDGSLVMADEVNMVLKRFNQSYKSVQTLKCPTSPGPMCKLTEHEVILSSNTDIYSVSIKDKMILEKKVASLKSICRAITFDSGLFYLAHGGGNFRGQAHIGVYDLHFNIKKQMGRDWLDCPVGVVVNKSRDRIYVTDINNGLITFNKAGHCLHIYNERDINYPGGICEIANDILLVAGKGSNNVLEITKGKTKVQELFRREDGITKPLCLCFDERNSRLIVLMGGIDHFRVYDLR